MENSELITNIYGSKITKKTSLNSKPQNENQVVAHWLHFAH